MEQAAGEQIRSVLNVAAKIFTGLEKNGVGPMEIGDFMVAAEEHSRDRISKKPQNNTLHTSKQECNYEDRHNCEFTDHHRSI